MPQEIYLQDLDVTISAPDGASDDDIRNWAQQNRASLLSQSPVATARARQRNQAAIGQLSAGLGITPAAARGQGISPAVGAATVARNRAGNAAATSRDQAQQTLDTMRRSFAGLHGMDAPGVLEPQLQAPISQAQRKLSALGFDPGGTQGNALDRAGGLLIKNRVLPALGINATTDPALEQYLAAQGLGGDPASAAPPGSYGEAIVPGMDATVGQQGGALGAAQQFAYGSLSPTNLATLAATEGAGVLQSLIARGAIRGAEAGLTGRIAGQALGQNAAQAVQAEKMLAQAAQTTERAKMAAGVSRALGVGRTAAGAAFTGMGALGTVDAALDTDLLAKDPAAYFTKLGLQTALTITPTILHGMNERANAPREPRGTRSDYLELNRPAPATGEAPSAAPPPETAPRPNTRFENLDVRTPGEPSAPPDTASPLTTVAEAAQRPAHTPTTPLPTSMPLTAADIAAMPLSALGAHLGNLGETAANLQAEGAPAAAIVAVRQQQRAIQTELRRRSSGAPATSPQTVTTPQQEPERNPGNNFLNEIGNERFSAPAQAETSVAETPPSVNNLLTETPAAPPEVSTKSLQSPPAETPSAKEPWQMTARESITAIDKGTVGQRRHLLEAFFPEWLGAQSEFSKNDFERGIWTEYHQGKQFPDRPGVRTPLNDISAKHKMLVQQAIAEGKTVPPEVLAEYPDLAPIKPQVAEIPAQSAPQTAEIAQTTEQRPPEKLVNNSPNEKETVAGNNKEVSVAETPQVATAPAEKGYFVRSKKQKAFVPVEGTPFHSDLFPNEDFFVHPSIEGDDVKFRVSEGKSGAFFAGGDTEAEAIEKAHAILKRVAADLPRWERTKKKALAERGLSPRYASGTLTETTPAATSEQPTARTDKQEALAQKAEAAGLKQEATGVLQSQLLSNPATGEWTYVDGDGNHHTPTTRAAATRMFNATQKRAEEASHAEVSTEPVRADSGQTLGRVPPENVSGTEGKGNAQEGALSGAATGDNSHVEPLRPGIQLSGSLGDSVSAVSDAAVGGGNATTGTTKTGDISERERAEQERVRARKEREAAEAAVKSASKPDADRIAPEERPLGVNYRVTDADSIGDTTKREKAYNLLAAIRTLKAVEGAGRRATPEEQKVLSRFPGWGWTGNDLNPDHSGERFYQDVMRLLTTEEVHAALRATQNSHYTSPQVIASMYEALGNFGFDGGKVLEPSAGIGLFFGLMPENTAAASSLQAVELDDLTGRILRELYQNAKVDIKGYQDARLPDDYFDLIVSNVPFGPVGVSDPKFSKKTGNSLLLSQVHNYFLAKSIDKVRPGGLLAVISTHGSLDGRHPAGVATRRYLAAQADLLGAIRLPNTAFQRNAATEVTTDILYFRKRLPGEEPGGEAFQKVEEIPDEHGVMMPINEYFINHPDMVLGTHSMQGKMRRGGGQEYTLLSDGRDMKAALAEAIDKLPKAIYTPHTSQATAPAKTTGAVQVARYKSRPGSLLVAADKSVHVSLGEGELEPFGVDPKHVPMIERFITLRDATGDLIEAMKQGAKESEKTKLRAALKTGYDAFVKAHGPLNKTANRNIYLQDPEAYTVLSLEQWNRRARKVTGLSDIFTKDVIRPDTTVSKVDNAVDALAASLYQRGRVDMAEMQRISNIPEEEIARQLVEAGRLYHVPGESYQTAEEYGSGNVRLKLTQAKAEVTAGHEEYQKNVDFLETVQPPLLRPVEIAASIGARWIPNLVYQQFIDVIGGGSDASVEYAAPTSSWKVNPGSNYDNVKQRVTYGTKDITSVKLFEQALNGKVPTIAWTDDEGKRHVDREGTAAAKAKQEEIKAAWDGWVYQNDKRAEVLAHIYNNEVNVYRERHYDGSFLTFPGQNPTAFPKGLRAHQKNAIWRMMQDQGVLLAHEVGTGKTATMIAGAMELRRIGLRNKPMILVKRSTISQFATTFKLLYPGAKILVADKDNFSTHNRRLFMSQIATGDWDAVIVTHSAFKLLPVHPDTSTRYYTEQMNQLRTFLAASIKENGKNSFTAKQTAAKIDRLEAKLKDLQAKMKETQDDSIYWDDLGVDHIMVDEAQAYKNLEIQSQLDGLANDGNDITFDMYMKLTDLTKKGGGITFATGTPLTNSVSEMHTLLRYLAPGTLATTHMQAFDEWARTFAKAESVFAQDVAGRWRAETRFVKFHNAAELIQLYRTVADQVLAEDIPGLKRPDLIDREGNVIGKPIVVESEPDEYAMRFFAEMIARAEEIVPPQHPDFNGDTMLSLSTDGRHVSLDARLRVPEATDFAGSKINKVVDAVLWEYHQPEAMANKRTQLVFIDLGQPGKTRTFDLYNDATAKLVKGGIPRQEIAWIDDAKSDEAREALFEKVNTGEIRVLFGSREKMGVGVNVQERLIALHQVDPTWRPDQIEQADGRIIRQGNLFNDQGVRIYQYVNKGTFDSFMWNKIAQKAGFIKQVLKGNLNAREFEDLSGDQSFSLDQMRAVASGDPRIEELLGGKEKVKQMEEQRRAYQNGQYDIKRRIGSAVDTVAYHEQQIPQRERVTAIIEAATPKEFELKIGQEVYTKREEAGKAILKAGMDMPREAGAKFLAEYRGFRLYVEKNFFMDRVDGKPVARETAEVTLKMPGMNIEEVKTILNPNSGSGAITRIDNIVEREKDRADQAKESLRLTQEEIPQLEAQLDKPWPKEAEYAALKGRMATLEGEIGTDLSQKGKQGGWGSAIGKPSVAESETEEETGLTSYNSGVTPADVWNSLPASWRTAIEARLPQKGDVTEWSRRVADEVRNWAYEGLSGMHRTAPDSEVATVRYAASNSMADNAMRLILPEIMKGLDKKQVAQLYPYLLADRIHSVRLALPKKIVLAQARHKEARKVYAALRRSYVATKGLMVDRVSARAHIGELSKLRGEITRTAQRIRQTRLDAKHLLDQQKNLSAIPDPVSGTIITPEAMKAFLETPAVQGAVKAHRALMEPLLEQNYVESGYDPKGIRGHFSDAWVPGMAVDEEGMPLGLGGGADAWKRAQATLSKVPGAQAFRGTAKNYATDYEDALGIRLRAGQRAANQRQMVLQWLADGVAVRPPKKAKPVVEGEEEQEQEPERLRRELVKDRDGKSVYEWQVEYQGRWQPATEITLAQKFKWADADRGSTLGLPSTIYMPVQLANEVEPIFDAYRPDEVTASLAKVSDNLISLYLISMADMVQHGAALNARLPVHVPVFSKVPVVREALRFSPQLSALFHVKNVMWFAHTDEQRAAASRFAAEAGVLPSEFPIRRKLTSPRTWIGTALYGERGALPNALATIWKHYGGGSGDTGIDSPDADEAKRAIDQARRAMRDLNTHTKGLESRLVRMIRKVPVLGKLVATFYQTGMKNRMVAYHAGNWYMAGLVGSILSTSFLVKALDKKHRYPWQIPGYKWGNIPVSVDKNGTPIYYPAMNFANRAQGYTEWWVNSINRSVATKDSLGRSVQQFGMDAVNAFTPPLTSGPLPAGASALTGIVPQLQFNKNLTAAELMKNKLGGLPLDDRRRVVGVLEALSPLAGLGGDVLTGLSGGSHALSRNEIQQPGLRALNTMLHVSGLPQMSVPPPEGLIMKAHRLGDAANRRANAKARYMR